MTVIEWLSKPRAPARRETTSIDSVLIFCGIGLLLSLVAILSGWLGLAQSAAF